MAATLLILLGGIIGVGFIGDLFSRKRGSLTLSAAGKGIDIALLFAGRVLYPTLVIWLIRGRRECEDTVPWV